MNKFSGRLTTLLIDSLVYPFCVILCGLLTIHGKMDTQTFIAVLGGYALLVKETRQDYFERKDRDLITKPNGGKDEKVP